jgi:hypothetical protein
MRTRLPLRVMGGAALVFAVVLTGCGDDGATSTDPPSEDVVLRVVQDGEVLADWTLADLEAAVPFTTITVDGDDQTGPLLLDVLAASGAEGWGTGEVLGLGEGRAFEVELEIAAADVNGGWVLDVTNQGTLKLAADDLPRQQWVRDVAEIRVR